MCPSWTLATSGDTHLGGDDFDERVMDYLADEFKKETGIDLRKDRQALQRLKDAAEKAKCELSTTLQTNISLPFITNVEGEGPKHLADRRPDREDGDLGRNGHPRGGHQQGED